MPKLHVVVTSTRPGRVGRTIGEWAFARAQAHGKFDARLVDLAEVNLPLFDEPEHPRFGRYQHEHTKKWSALVSEADAFVFVTPEYNAGPPPSFVNALTYLAKEWAYKPAAFVSYGGLSGGARGQQIAKLILGGVKIVTVYESVTIPMFMQHLDNGVFKGNEGHEKAATIMLDELLRWTNAMKQLRA